VLGPGYIAHEAEFRRTNKYTSLTSMYSFVSVAIETLGTIGEEPAAFLRDFGKRIASVTEGPRSFQLLSRLISVYLQRGNAACVISTVPVSAT